MSTAPKLFTIGHSTRPIEEFLAILQGYGVELLADIRTVPKSRHNPQFGQDNLAASVIGAGLHYVYLKDLGGLRPKHKESINGGWHNDSFRGFADYMQSSAFAAAIEDLTVRAGQQKTAIMCAEAVPWRCHRSLVGDAMLVRGWEVIDIMDGTHTRPHTMTRFAKVEGIRITYPPPG